MTERIRIGLLGAGAMGTEHASVYADMADVAVAGVFSRNVERARAVAELCGAPVFDEAAALIAATGVDAIDVCLPTPMHSDAVLPALAQGKHVFCETPMALNLGEARRMVAAARAADRLLLVGLLTRSVSYNAYVEALATSGECGRLLSVATERLGSYLRAGSAEHRAHYSDPSTELMTFDFDFILWLMGPPGRLSASAIGPAEAALEVSALLSYDDGRHASVAASGYMPEGYPFTVGFRALFEHAVIEARAVFQQGPPQMTFTRCEGGEPPRPIALEGRNPYGVELRRFVDCIRGEADPILLDAQRAVEALILSSATQRSLAEGWSVAITGS